MKPSMFAVTAAAFGMLLAGVASGPTAFAQSVEEPSSTGHASVHAYSLKNWEITSRVYAGYDDNVNFVSDGDPQFMGETESPVIGFTGAVAYRRKLGSGITVGGSVRLDQTLHTADQDNPDPNINDDADEYDTFSASGRAFVERHWQINERRAHVGASYEIAHETAEIDAIGGTGHYLRLYGEYEPTFHSSVGAEVTIGSRDFEVAFNGNPELQRDGMYYAAKVHGRLDLDGRRRSVGAYLQITENDADGPTFKYSGVSVGVTPTLQINGPLWLNLEASADWRDYDGAPYGIPRTEQTLYKASAQLVLFINRSLTADASISHLKVDANDTLFEGDRTAFLVGIQARY